MANRGLIGNRSTGGYGLYISKSGSDVLTCNYNELVFNTSLSDSTSGIVDNKGAMYSRYANGVVTRTGALFAHVTTWPTSDFTYEDKSV